MINELKATFKDAVISAIPVVASEDITPEIHEQMQHFLATLLADGIAPFLEKKLRDLFDLIAQEKKGFKNQVKNWWKRGNEKYEFNFQIGGLEHSLRWIGDLAFITGDYQLAYTFYSQSANDFYRLKVFRHAAVAYEMLAITSYLRGDNIQTVD